MRVPVLCLLLVLAGCLETARPPAPNVPDEDVVTTPASSTRFIVYYERADAGPGALPQPLVFAYAGQEEVRDEWSRSVLAHNVTVSSPLPGGPAETHYFEASTHRWLGRVQHESGGRMFFQDAGQGPLASGPLAVALLFFMTVLFEDREASAQMADWTLRLAPAQGLDWSLAGAVCEPYEIHMEPVHPDAARPFVCLGQGPVPHMARLVDAEGNAAVAIWQEDDFMVPVPSGTRPGPPPEVPAEEWLHPLPGLAVAAPPVGYVRPYEEPAARMLEALATLPSFQAYLAQKPESYMSLFHWQRHFNVVDLPPALADATAQGLALTYMTGRERGFHAFLYELGDSETHTGFVPVPPGQESDPHIRSDLLPDIVVALNTAAAFHPVPEDADEWLWAVPLGGAWYDDQDFPGKMIWAVGACGADDPRFTVLSAMNGQIMYEGRMQTDPSCSMGGWEIELPPRS